MQHRAISWLIESTSIVRVEKLSEHSVFWEGAFRKWMNSLNGAQRQQFVDSLFLVLKKAEIANTDQLKNMNLRRFITLLRAVDRLNEGQREALNDAFRKLLYEMDAKGDESKKYLV